MAGELTAGTAVGQGMVEILGREEARRQIRRLSDKGTRAALRNTFRNAWRVEVQKEAKRRAPVRTRKLKNAIGVSVSVSQQHGIRVDAGVRRRRPGLPSKYAHLQEFGTTHHGAHAFLKPAFDAKADDAARYIAIRLKDEIEKVAAKGGRMVRG